MPVEIERKFLVTGNAWRQGEGVCISQGYLNRDPERTVRVRLAGDQAYLTVKGRTTGCSRVEFEYRIPISDGEELLRLCEGSLVRKLRHVVVYQGTKWEIDEFLDANTGLVVAEIELADAEQPFAHPEWLGAEVTDDPRFFNSNLVTTPFSLWS